MRKRAKKDVKLLLVLASVIFLFNLVSLQFLLFGGNRGEISKEFAGQTLPSEARQKDVVTPASSGKEGADDSNVYRYVNDKLKKYGYEPISLGEEQDGSPSSNSGQASDSIVHLNGNSNQNQNSNENNNSNQQNNDQDNSENTDDEDEEENNDSELPTVPPNETGPPTQEVEGSVNFGIKTGIK